MERDASVQIELPYLHLSGESKKNHRRPQCPSRTGCCQNTKVRKTAEDHSVLVIPVTVRIQKRGINVSASLLSFSHDRQ
jgi:hypothetical protein